MPYYYIKFSGICFNNTLLSVFAMDFLFPHTEPRKIQKGLMEQVYSAISQKFNLIVHAPTGIGKTASALSPALTYALKNKKTIFFLTSRHTQHKIAIDTLKMIGEKYSIKIKVADIIGKRHMCGQSGISELGSSEFSEYCKSLREKGSCLFYSNFKSKGKVAPMAVKVLSDLEKLSPVGVEEVNNICIGAEICPYEITGALGIKADVIIADYYHLLSPSIRDSLFKRMQKDLGECIVILDESHNLPERARNILTSMTSTIVIDFAVKEARQLGFNEIADSIIKIGDAIMVLARKIPIDSYEVFIEKSEFIKEIEKIKAYELLVGELRVVADAVLEERKRSAASGLANFLDSWCGPDDGFARIMKRDFSKNGKPYTSISYKCMDPSITIRPFVESVHSAVFMSGTLNPAEMYRDLFGLDAGNTIVAEYENPFPKENKMTLIIPETSTKFTVRSRGMYELIAKKCADIANTVPGNIAMFFPSYQIRDDVYAAMQSACEKTAFLEQPKMSQPEKNEMLERFKSYKYSGAVLLAASSGSFGEGIDLIGDYLKCVTVVGLPLSKPDLETQKLIEYYDKKFNRGRDYGYIYPALIKTMQNAGRCIRSETDRGVIVFLDERYLWNRYYRCFPQDWNIKVSSKPMDDIKEFFLIKTGNE